MLPIMINIWKKASEYNSQNIDYMNQDEDTSLNRSAYNNNSSFQKLRQNLQISY